MNRRPFLSGRTLLSAAVLAACASAGVPALAQSSPYILRASQEFTYDSNIFRQERSRRQDDLISTTTLGAAIDQRYGRQRYLADASVVGNLYRKEDQLNSTGYGLLLGMDWEAAQRLSGTIRLRSAQESARFEEFGATRDTSNKNLERINAIDLSGQYGGVGKLSLEAGAGYRDISYSNRAYDDREYDQGYVDAGVGYQPSDFLRFGLLFRYTEGSYPNIPVLDLGGVRTGTIEDKFDRNDIQFNVNWRPTGLSTIDTRLAWTVEDHDQVQSRDFDGLTGSVRWLYRPTAKSRLNLGISRDTRGRSGAYSELGEVGAGGDSRLSTRLFGDYQWLATAKITVNASASYSRDKYDRVEDDEGFAARRTRDGNTQAYSLGADYAVTRTVAVGCSVSRLTRSADAQAVVEYVANVAQCSVKLAIQ